MDSAGRLETRDAVVVIPGVMGSALRDLETGQEIWGLRDLRWYARAWIGGDPLARLAVTDGERAGRTGRIAPTGLLTAAAWAPVLRGVEPYRRLLADLTRVLGRDAVLGFAYDWRLSVAHNAGLLADAATAHLERWRRHPTGSADARLVLVAHSMGGLVARWFTEVLGHADDVRRTITLGTPYHGSVKAAVMLGTGRGTPVRLPTARLRDAARTMPGLHDLLPFYRCVDDGAQSRHLTAADVGSLGGDPELAAEAQARHARLLSGNAGPLRLLVGTKQPTWQSLTLRAGTVEPLETELQVDSDGRVLGRRDRQGDGTVYRRAAAAFGLEPSPLPQAHGALAGTSEAIAFVRDVLTDDTSGPPLGDTGGLGVRVSDVQVVDEPLTIEVTGGDALGTRYAVIDMVDNRPVHARPLRRSGDVLRAEVDLPYPGLFRVEVKAGGQSPVTEHVMGLPPETPLVAEDR